MEVVMSYTDNNEESKMMVTTEADIQEKKRKIQMLMRKNVKVN